MFSCLLVALALTSAAYAAPSPIVYSGCSVNNAVLTLPPGQTGLVEPNAPTAFITAGVGVQNYTCNDAGTFTSVGAVAELIDISCLFGTEDFEDIPGEWFDIWKIMPQGSSPLDVLDFVPRGNTAVVLGEHFFIVNPLTGSGLSPKWDFTSRGDTNGNPNAFVVGARTGGIPAPSGPADVDWLSLSGVQGSLASQVFRVDTRGGQPPASCTPGSSISVRYTSKYWFTGSSL
ncbi:hypothetical protein ONZ45_g12789 [Pleurotus djamor]|nr:hypothetical protein ONZ45_g12789 [Pleurotus djamor]